MAIVAARRYYNKKSSTRSQRTLHELRSWWPKKIRAVERGWPHRRHNTHLDARYNNVVSYRSLHAARSPLKGAECPHQKAT